MKIKQSINSLILVFIFLNILTAANAQSRTTLPRLHPDPKALEFYQIGRQNNGYSWTELAEISLWASSGEVAASHMERIRTVSEAIKTSADFPAGNRERADFILNYMHRNILRSYSLYQTRVDTMLSNGRFNCVSSAVLYMILCESAGIRTSGVVTKDHAFVIVHIDGENIDVETTNAFGFDPGNRREFHDQFGRLGFTYVPAQNYRDRQTINQVELVSLIMVNRIAEHERQNRFAESVPVAIDRAALLKGDFIAINVPLETTGEIFSDPRNDLMDRLFNFGAMLLRAGREEDSLHWAAEASSVYPDKERWQEFILAVANNHITRLTRANRLAEARDFLDTQRPVLTEASYIQLDAMLLDSELLRSANQIQNAADGDAVINAIVQAHAEEKIGNARAAELITFAVQRTASALSAAPARDWRAAVIYIEAALERFGAESMIRHRELEQAFRTYRNNLAADYHNRFAAEWNSRNFEEAERILNEGLAEFPDNRQLLSNRQTVERHRSQ